MSVTFENPVSAFPQGREIPYDPATVTKEDIIDFASEYDPAFFHVDEIEAKKSWLGGLAASGFHTCSLTMRMICDAFILQSTCQGSPGVDDLSWSSPVRPGDTLQGVSTVVESRKSGSKPGLFIAKFRHETSNQNGEPVLVMTNTVLFKIPDTA